MWTEKDIRLQKKQNKNNIFDLSRISIFIGYTI